MSLKEFCSSFSKLVDIFGEPSHFTKNSVELYFEMFKGLTAEQWSRVVRSAIEGETYFPTPAALQRHVDTL